MNINCVICSDSFIPADSVFTTPCGHIFHHVCLIQWMERKKDCPQCRQKCTDRNIFRIYFNNTSNLDSTIDSANLIETIDKMALKAREQEIALKKIDEEKRKIEETLEMKEKKIKKLDATVSQYNLMISTMKHEVDVLSRHRANYKVIETENTELKTKLNLLQSVECILTASQREIDDVVNQNLSFKDLTVMVGTLRRELNNTESRKNDLRKQLQTIRNELRREQEEKRMLQDELSKLESENNSMLNKFKKVKLDPNIEVFDTPEIFKGIRPALITVDNQNTPSPLNQKEFNKRIQNIQESDSPYFRVKKSSIALACVLKNPTSLNPKTKTSSNGDASKLSIFKKPRISQDPYHRLNQGIVYNGIGGTSKILESDLKLNLK